MPNPSKTSSMLCDIQYVRPDRKTNTPDYLYIIWKDLYTKEKHLEIVPEPKMDIYFEKNEFRNHSYNKTYAKISELDKKTVKSKDIIFAIADDMGEQGKAFLSNVFNTKNYGALKDLYLYPYVFGADYDPVAWYRIQWLRNLNNDMPKKLTKGFLDIEVDGLEVPGMPNPIDCPINAITLIDESANVVYTFLFTHREFIPKDTSHMNEKERIKEMERKKRYQYMHEAQNYMMDHQREFNHQLHEKFDDLYGEFDYKLYFYDDERKMLVHLFQLINSLKLDFIGIWNMSFDIPYIIKRLEYLGMDPAKVMCHPDFPSKVCRFKADTHNYEIKNKSDQFFLSSYTVFYDQMELYASIRKGASELRSFKLNYIAQKELKDSKLDYSEDGDIKTLPYTNFPLFTMYNIKDVLLQVGIERRTTDFDTLYVSSYNNATPYDKVFKQTVKLRNVQYVSFLDQGLIPGSNVNIYNSEENIVKSDDEDDDDENFEGALVADPIFNDKVGIYLYGQPTNNIFNNAIDMDMSAFYPSSIFAMNIDASTLIFKAIMPIDQFDIMGGSMKFKGITGPFFEREDDAAKECIDNFQTGNYMSTATKWLNLPDVNTIYKLFKKRRRKQ